MTSDEFRESPLRARLETLLSDPSFTQAFVILETLNKPQDCDAFATEVASVRALSRMSGYAAALSDLQTLSTVTPNALPEPRATFGLSPEEMPDETL